MAGHSKWAQIKHQKAIADKKRGILFSKLANAITIAAKEGSNPETNFKLRLAIEKAKSVNMPQENIERAIKRATKTLEGEKLEKIQYEAYGPGGVAFLIEVITDNRNRTVGTLRHIFNKYGGNLASTGSVKWMFEQKGVIKISPQDQNKEELELRLIDAGIEELEENEELTIYTSPEKLIFIKNLLEKWGIKPLYSEIEWFPKNKIKIENSLKEKIENISKELENIEEVDDFYINLQ